MSENAHAFTVHVGGIDQSSVDALYEAGCDDATIAIIEGEMQLDFEREAASFGAAAGSAMHDIEKAGGRILRVERIED